MNSTSETSTPVSGGPAESHKPHVPLPGGLGALADEAAAEGTMLSNAIGGWRGIIDSSLPAAVFLLVYLLNGNSLMPAVWSAVGAGVLIAVWRLVRKQSIQQIFAGFVGVAISAFVAAKTGNAVDFFLPGLLINVAYGLALAISAAVGWPAIGLAVGAATGDVTGWREDPALRRAYTAATWIFASMFILRVVVQAPAYLAEAVGPLGVLKIAMGWPLTLLCGFWAYRLIKPPFTAARNRAKALADDVNTDAGAHPPVTREAEIIAEITQVVDNAVDENKR